MKKIRIKVKNLILILVVFAFIVGYVIPLTVLAIAKGVEKKDEDKAIKYYEAYADMFSFYNKNQETLYKLGKLTVPSIDNYDMFFSIKGGGKSIPPEKMERAIEYYKEVLKGDSKNRYYPLAYRELLHIYTGLNEVEKAYELMDKGANSSNEEVRLFSDEYRAFYYFVNREYNKALEIVDRYLDNGTKRKELYDLKGHIYFAKGYYDVAKECYKVKNDVYYSEVNSNTFGIMRDTNRAYWLDKFLRYKGENKLKGKVTYQGKGIPFVQIYVRDKSEDGYSPHMENFVAITDFNGEFETPGFKDGDYEIGIGICETYLFDKVCMEKGDAFITIDKDTEYNVEFVSPFNIVKPKGEYSLKGNTFQVKWEEVPGAKYYRVMAVSFDDPEELKGGSVTYCIPTSDGVYEVEGTDATFNIDDLNSAPSGISYAGEEMIINPQAVLGTFYPGARVPIIVNAYDGEGKMINSTLPLKTTYEDVSIVKVNNRERTEGEKLILNKKYEKAIKYYENVLKEKPKDKTALQYLTRFYLLGWKEGKKDIDRAFELSQRLYDVTGDIKVLENLISSMDYDELRKKKDDIEPIIMAIYEKDKSEDTYFQLGRFYLANGSFDKSIESFEKIHEPYAYEKLFFIYLYKADFDIALKRLEEENFKFYNMNKEKLKEGVEGLKKVPQNSSDWKEFKGFLEVLINGDKGTIEAFESAYRKIGDSSMRLILKELGLSNNWIREENQGWQQLIPDFFHFAISMTCSTTTSQGIQFLRF